MSELERRMLLVMLKSQLQIENSVLESFGNVTEDATDVIIKITKAKMQEIRRQIAILEKTD